MKKFLSLMLAVVFMTVSLTACGAQKPADTKADNDKMKIVTTIFPEYDWVNEILGDKASDAEVTMLLDNGADLHSYQPNAEDISKIAACDLFIYVGGESDEWVEDALKEATNKDMKVINLLDVLGDKVKDEEVKEGMEAEHEEGEADDHDDDIIPYEADNHDEHHHDSEEPEADEHVWLSLKNAAVLCDAIATAVSEIDSENAAIYAENVKAYKEKLSALDAEYEAAVEHAGTKTLLFGDRFPFRYMVDDYGLDYYAAFVGCSAETEASFETIKFLANKVDELKLKFIMTIDGSDHKIAETIIQNTKDKNQTILTIDSMQSKNADDVKNGATYLDIMTDNLEVLKTALK